MGWQGGYFLISAGSLYVGNTGFNQGVASIDSPCSRLSSRGLSQCICLTVTITSDLRKGGKDEPRKIWVDTRAGRDGGCGRRNGHRPRVRYLLRFLGA